MQTPCGSCCWVTLACAVAWVLVGSALAMFSWNKVIAKVGSYKAVKFWQVLLLFVTIGVVFCAPRYASKSCMGGEGKSCHSKHCNDCGEHAGCPWSAKDAQLEGGDHKAAPTTAPAKKK